MYFVRVQLVERVPVAQAAARVAAASAEAQASTIILEQGARRKGAGGWEKRVKNTGRGGRGRPKR